jgi:uncharacterized protein (UPF0332 family)
MQFDLLLDKAERFMHTAEVAATGGDLDSSASRLYYAMFYIAEALLAARSLSFSSHHAVLAAYGQHFANWPGFGGHCNSALGCA